MNVALQELEQMHLQEQMRKYPNYPKEYFITPKFKIKEANGLTAAITHYIDLKGGYASRINSGGVYDQKLGTHRHGTTKRGFSDIQGVYNGLALYIEIKIAADRQSEYQKEFQKSVTKAGGLYFIAKDFESFVYWWKTLVDKKEGGSNA